jgi:hypothetical protein
MTAKTDSDEDVVLPEPTLTQSDAHASSESEHTSIEREPLASPETSAVPNLDESVRLGNDYYSYTKQAVSNMLFKCWTLARAKHTFDATGFDQFCRELRLPAKSAAFKKLFLIGENVVRLLPIEAALPDDRELLYQLAKLPDEILQHFVLTRRIRPSMTLPELRDALSKYREQRGSMPIEEDRAQT